MLILRVPIYIFGILRHLGSMILTQFLWRVKATTQICFKAGVLIILNCQPADLQPRHLCAPDAGREPAGVHAVRHAGYRPYPALRAGEGSPHLAVHLRGHGGRHHLRAVEPRLGRCHEAVRAKRWRKNL